MKKYTLALIVALSLVVGCDSQKPAADAPAEAEKPAAEVKPEVAKEDAPKEAPTSAPTSAPAEEKKKVELPDDMKPGETKLYGAKFTIIEPPITLASAIEKSGAAEGPYKVEAQIEKVCAKKGCWFTLAGEGVDKPVRVRMKDYGFFVPRNTASAKAILEGTLKAREMPKDEAQHYAEDEGKSAEEVAKIEGGKTFEFTAVAVEVTMPKS